MSVDCPLIRHVVSRLILRLCCDAVNIPSTAYILGHAMLLLVVHRTCDLQVAGWNPGWAPPRSSLGKATYTCMPLSPSIILYEGK